MSSEEFTERVLRFIGRTDYKPQKLRSLARSIGIGENEYGAFHDTVSALMKTGRIVAGSSKVLTLPEPVDRFVGSYRSNPRGFGFVIPESPDAHGDLFVPQGQSLDAITGDTVVARVAKRGKRAGKMLYEGRIVEVLKRGQSQFVGELCKEFGRWFVQPDGNTIHVPIFVDDPGAKSARAGDQVVVEVIRFPKHMQDARGVITRVLGERGLPEVDTLSMIVQYQLPEGFEEDVLREASKVSQAYDPESAAADRDDLRKTTIITIDPDDARDFDDAISLTENTDGTVELGIHIADVSHFVTPGSALDEEAHRRSTSVYFPRHVIPMLPELLSNGVCSLQERVPRLTKSAFITYNAKGVIKKQRFANTIIRSTKRLTYQQAANIIDGKPGRLSKKIVDLVERMARLARAIRARRIREGMLVLDLPDVDLVFDEHDHVVGLQPADNHFSHTVIEMFMVEANDAVARHLAALGIPCLRRIHPEPNEAAGETLAKFLAALGVKAPTTLDRFGMQEVLKKVKGKPAAFAANLALLRSMQQAVYSPKLIGHFALASEHYLHFTSPIRRYPDLTVHRLLDANIRGKLQKPKHIANVPQVEELKVEGAHCSHQERRAEAAERELRLVKILRLLEDQVGDTFEGVVTGVTNFGIYVQLREYLVDGLMRFNELSDDWWEVDSERGFVVAERSGQRIAIGQVLKVVIVRVDLPGRHINLAPEDVFEGSGKKAGGRAKVRSTKRKGVAKGKGPKGRGPKRSARGRRRK